MPKASTKSNKQKLASVHKICNAMQRRNKMSDDKKENCIRGISKKWGIGRKGRKKRKEKKRKESK